MSEEMCADFNTTGKSPLNRSISKQLYSFPKAPRFSSSPQSLCKGSYLIKRGAFGNRATTFGYGNKMSLIEGQDVPAVGKYDIKSEFLWNRDKRRGYSFNKQYKSSVLVNPQKAALMPGPGAYEQYRTLNTDRFKKVSYTIGQKLGDPVERHRNSLGPGQYQTIPSLNKTGNYFISKFSGSGCGIIGRSRRASLVRNAQVPGPGQYSSEAKNSLNNTGIYFNSRFRNKEAAKFPKSMRQGVYQKNANPGPGSQQSKPLSQWSIHLIRQFEQKFNSVINWWQVNIICYKFDILLLL